MKPEQRARMVARVVAVAPLQRRLDACRRFGVDRYLDRDPVGRVLEGYRSRDGLTITRSTVPLGVVGIEDGDTRLIADCILAGNAAVVTGFDVTAVRSAITDAGLPADVVVAVGEMPQVEIDALRRGGSIVVAERLGVHSHLYVDADAAPHHVTYLAVNAAAHEAIDTLVLHQGFDVDATADLKEALEHAGHVPAMLPARSVADAADIVERRSSGRVETIVSSSLAAIRDFEWRVDSAVLVVNASPAFVEDSQSQREVVGLTRSRVRIEGDGQTKPLPSKAATADD